MDINKFSNHKNCSYCNKPFTEELWCKECDPFRIIEGWTSGNHDVDKIIKDTIYNARQQFNGTFLEWVPFDRFKEVEQIGEGGFAKVYSAIWIDGKAKYAKQNDGSWKKSDPRPMKVALKRLNGSQNMSDEYLRELKIHCEFYLRDARFLEFYGMTKDPNTKEFMMIIQYANKGSLRSFLLSNFSNILWKDKILLLCHLILDLDKLHKFGYFHKDFHSGNILQLQNSTNGNETYISDFGLSGPANEQKSDNNICGVLPYIAPEVLNGKSYTKSSDIYSFGIVMIELSSGKPPFYKRKHDDSLALEICNGLRPEFGKGTPEVYKELARKCTDANPDQRPIADELHNVLNFWWDSFDKNKFYQEREEFGYKGKEIKAMFEKADKEIPNILTSFEKNPDAIYTSRRFTFNLSNITSSYFSKENNKDYQDSQLVNLEVTSTSNLSFN